MQLMQRKTMDKAIGHVHALPFFIIFWHITESSINCYPRTLHLNSNTRCKVSKKPAVNKKSVLSSGLSVFLSDSIIHQEKEAKSLMDEKIFFLKETAVAQIRWNFLRICTIGLQNQTTLPTTFILSIIICI